MRVACVGCVVCCAWFGVAIVAHVLHLNPSQILPRATWWDNFDSVRALPTNTWFVPHLQERREGEGREEKDERR